MRPVAIMLSICGALALSSCEREFDEKFEDRLEELENEAQDIESQAEERLAAGRETDNAAEQLPVKQE